MLSNLNAISFFLDTICILLSVQWALPVTSHTGIDRVCEIKWKIEVALDVCVKIDT